MSEFEAVVERVRERVDPTPDERAALAETVERLTDRAREAVTELDVDADVLQVGSTARGTWVAGDRDIDLFVRFPPDISREDLEAYGLQVGNAVLPEGREEYAEHPYVKGVFEGTTSTSCRATAWIRRRTSSRRSTGRRSTTPTSWSAWTTIWLATCGCSSSS